MKSHTAFFFAIAVIVVSSLPNLAFAETQVQTGRFKDYSVEQLAPHTYRQTLGMVPYVWDGSQWTDRIISNNGTHFNVYSEMGSFSFNKANCAMTQYVKGFDPITTSAKGDDIVIGNWFWTIARKNGANPWEVIDPAMFNCSVSTFQNATGKYLTMTRTHAGTGSYLKVTLAAPNDSPMEDFAETYMNIPAWSGNKFAFVLWAKDVKTQSLTYRNGTTIQIPEGITLVDRSNLTVDSMNFIKNGNLFYFDWMKAKDHFKTLSLNKTGSLLDVQFGFNNNPVTLTTGQKMGIDPTYGYTTGTETTARTTTGAGVACPAGPYDTSAENMVGLPDSGTAGRCRRVLEQWDISTIPTGADVSSMTLRYDVTLFPNVRNCNIYSIEFKPSTATAITNYFDAGNGTAFITNDNTCASVGNDKTEVLPSTAYSDLEANLPDGWWAVGFVFNNQVRDGLTHEMTISAIELQVVYTIGPPDPITTLATSSYDTDSVDLTFTAPNLNGGTLQRYVFNYTTPCGDPLTALPNGTTATSYSVSGLTKDTCYSFRASAATEGGFNDSGNILNVTTLAFNQANFTVGDLSFNAQNSDVIPIFFTRTDINSTALYLNVTYPDTWELACDFHYKFAMTNHTYKNLSTVVVDADQVKSIFEFSNVNNEIINVDCWDQNGTGGEGKYLITQTAFPMLTYIQKFSSGHYGTSGDFGSIDLAYLAVIIVSMVGLNRTNESVGAGFMIVITAAMAYFHFITIPTAAISGIGLVIMLIIISTRKD